MRGAGVALLVCILLVAPPWTRQASAEDFLEVLVKLPTAQEIKQAPPFLGSFLLEVAIAGARIVVFARGDPSICYSAEVHNSLTEAEDEFGNPTGNVFLSWDMPIAPLGANSVRATLEVELVDANQDGVAYMTHRAGFAEFQRAFLVQGASGESLGVHLGLPDLTAPGVYAFEAGFETPIAGPTSAEAAVTSLISTFILSPGDTVLLRGKVVQDDGSGTPECEIPGPDFVTGCSEPGAILGTDEADVLEGTPGDDVICGGAGNDRIDGKGGNDRIFGGLGRDSISGGAGRDFIYGEDGNDVLCGDAFAGAPGRDVGTDPAACVSGGPGGANDTIDGGPGDDAIGGGPGADRLRGGPGDDKIAGGAGRDRLFGEEGRDRLAGGAGRDQLRGGAGADRMLGDEGDDKIIARDGVADLAIDGGDGDDRARIDAGLDPAPSGVERLLP